MIQNIIIIVICAIANRIRGGLRIKGHKLPLNKYWFAVAFACCYCWLTEWSLNKWLVVMIATRLGSQLYGYGSAVGTLIVGKITDYDREDCELIDDILNNLTITLKGHKILLKRDYPLVWAFLWVCLRGLIWTFLIGLAIDSIPFMFAGLSMGVVYGTCGFIGRKFFNKYDKTFWNVSEYVFGGVLGFFLTYIIS